MRPATLVTAPFRVEGRASRTLTGRIETPRQTGAWVVAEMPGAELRQWFEFHELRPVETVAAGGVR